MHPIPLVCRHGCIVPAGVELYLIRLVAEAGYHEDREQVVCQAHMPDAHACQVLARLARA